MFTQRSNSLFILGLCLSFVTWISMARPGEYFYDPDPADTTKKTKKSKTSDYTPEDRHGDPYSHPGSKSPMLLPLPKNIETDVILDDSLKTYTIEENVGELEYRPASTMTFEEYSRYKNQQMMKTYWKDKTGGDSSVANTDEKSLVPKLKVSGLKGIFGGDYMEMRPTGVVTLDFGARWQRVYNPNIPIRQQRQGQFDFDQTISMNVVGKIGEKLKLTTNWDTKAAFEFQNNLKLEYTGFEEDIIQKIEAGNVSLPVNSALFSGAQNLFGVKTKLQFGRFTATTVFSTQRGKAEEIKVQGGAMNREFEIRADNYDEYRHFFLSHFHRDNYERSLRNLPVVTSGVVINRVQVWITNRVSNTKDLKNFVAYTDLGEPDTTNMYNPSHFKTGIPQAKADSNIAAADNNNNTLYSNVQTVRDATTAANTLQAAPYNLVRGSDFEIINQGRKLLPTEYKFHPNLGYISLNTPLRPDEVLAVSFEYTYDGKTYQVGELTEDNQTVDANQVIILKLLKPATIKTRLPTWDLMMKNIYQLGATQITRENFQLRVIYKNDITGADLPNLQEGQNTATIPLLRLTGLDKLNPNNDGFPDGNFDYVEDLTIDSRNGRIIFPVLEPFGETIGKRFLPTEANLRRKYVFFELYDSTKSDAQQIASKNKYFLKGRYQAGSSSEIVLPGINIAPGSVTVLAGSNPLVEGVDYEIDYNLGRLRIKNQGVLQSNTELTIRFEKQDFINFRRKSFIGARFDYKINRDFYIGSTILHQTESPNISRVNIGDEPSRNTIVGLDANFKAESRFLTRALDKLPLLSTKAVSTINFSGEGAALLPGYPKILDRSGKENGTSYLDDFEGAETPYDLTRIPTKWKLGATPMRFTEATSSNLDYTYHRAKLAWYSVDMGFFNGSQNAFQDFQTGAGAEYRKNHFVRQVLPNEIFKNKDLQQIAVPEPILDLAFYPTERGPYNFNPDLSTTFANNPRRNWGAVTREIRNDIDFDNANIQYIEFWMLDPFMNSNYGKLPLTLDSTGWKPVTKGGYLYFNLGSISEDVMKDSRHAFENGLPVTDTDQGNINTNTWGKVTTKSFITNAFDNSNGSRPLQDVGLDGLTNAEEQQNPFISAIYKALADPAGDDFEYYIGGNQSGKGILERYKNFNGLENNSPLNTGNDFTPANSTLPDNEDLNGDNTLNEVEEYYEYKVQIDPSQLAVGNKYIVDRVDHKDETTGETVKWYQVRIPIREPDSIVGNINGFKSIRFMRMYMTGFEEPIVIRMAQFQLVANQWRTYQPDDINPPDASMSIEPSGSVLTVSTVNIEENGAAKNGKSAYVLPPGFQRDQDAVSQTYRRLNEQSLQLCITDLEDGKAKGAYKNVSHNLINYDKIKMFLHAESQDLGITDTSMQAFLRVGTDFTQNYYEINIPLKLSPPNATADFEVWPAENNIDIDIQLLTDVKGERNRVGANKQFAYSRTLSDGKIITVVGNPDLSAVMGMMIGVRNPKSPDKRSHSICVWANELRVTGFNQEAAYATTGRMNLKLADFATVNLSGRYTTVGWGALDQKVSQRERHNTGEWGVSSNVNLDKLIPEKVGLKLPMYVSLDQRIISPRFDPLDPDMLLKRSLENISDDDEREQYKSYVIDRTTRRSINFTNVQKVKTKKDAKSHIYDIENFSFTTAYSDTRRTNYNLKEYNQKYYKGEVVYTYNIKGKSIEPFKNAGWAKSPYLKLVRDFNFSPLPRTINFRSSLDRRLTKTQYYEGNPRDGFVQDPFFEKQFTFSRNYGLNWDLTKSLALDYKADAFAIIDEPNRDPSIEKENYRDSIWSNVLRGGRLKDFRQSIGVTYKLPIDKIPLTDWINADVKYNGGSTWSSGALGLRDTLGNLLQNNQTRGITGKFNLDKLYNKSKFLKNINTPPPPKKPTEKDTSKTLPKKEMKVLKTGIRTLMSMKSINFNYDVTRTTGLAGYMAIPKYMGLTPGGNSFEMLPFMFGSQDPRIRQIVAENGWMSTDRRLNAPFMQAKTTNFTAQTQLEPFKDFKVQMNVSKKKTTNYQELYRIDTSGTRFVSESPTRNGNLSLSIISIRTAFRGKIRGSNDPNSSVTFEEFEEYRNILRERLPNSALYDTNSQNVLIPAFLAAYTKRDPNKVSLNPYPTIPLPNWRIDYTGLTRIKAIRDIFPSFTIQHAYQSTYNIGNYNSSLLYGSDTINPYNDIDRTPFPGMINNNGSLVPIYIIESVNITEAFNPLIGVNFRTKKRLTGNIQFKKARQVTLNLTNAQVTEVISHDLTLGFGIIKTGFQPFKKMAPLKNELNAKMDVTFSDRKTIQRKFEESATLTAGNLNIQIRPNVTYAINQRVNVNLYFERMINAPKISSSYKSASTRFGVMIRFTLS